MLGINRVKSHLTFLVKSNKSDLISSLINKSKLEVLLIEMVQKVDQKREILKVTFLTFKFSN